MTYHWSFNHNKRQQPQFMATILGTLRCTYATPGFCSNEPPSTCFYDILPNFWSGYKGKTIHDSVDDLRIGEVSVSRAKHGGVWYYKVHTANTTNGEDILLEFCCDDDEYRSLRDSWRIDATNSAGDAYGKFTAVGHLTEGAGDLRETRLAVNGTEFSLGTLDKTLPLTSNWALFDIVPTLKSMWPNPAAKTMHIALLEDLERLRPQNWVKFLESTQIPLDGPADEAPTNVLQMNGYCLFGEGIPPMYWWADAYGHVAIVSTIHQTLVLRGDTGERQA